MLFVCWLTYDQAAKQVNVAPHVTVGFNLQTKYKEAGKKEVKTNLYSLLPLTMETQRAKEAAELLSEVNVEVSSPDRREMCKIHQFLLKNQEYVV